MPTPATKLKSDSPPVDDGEQTVVAFLMARRALAALNIRKVIRLIEAWDEPIHSPQSNPGSRPTGKPGVTYGDPVGDTAIARRHTPKELRDARRAVDQILDACAELAGIERVVTSESPKVGACWVCLKARGGERLDDLGWCKTCIKSCVKQEDRLSKKGVVLDREKWRRDRRRQAEQDIADHLAQQRARQLRKAG